MIDTQMLKVEGEKEKESSRWDGEIQKYIGARGRTEIFLTITATKYIRNLIHMYSTHYFQFPYTGSICYTHMPEVSKNSKQ